jgi:cyanophycinase
MYHHVGADNARARLEHQQKAGGPRAYARLANCRAIFRAAGVSFACSPGCCEKQQEEVFMLTNAFRLAVLLPLLLLAPGAARAASDGAPKGSLVIIGGALRGDNAPVWARIVQLAGGKGARIAVFASAAARPERAGQSNAERLQWYGADAFVVPVAVKLAGVDYMVAADDPALAAQVRSAGGAYFAGGDQGRITQALRRPDGSNTLVLDALWEMYRRGGVIAGTSAGAAIMSSTMFYEAKPVLATLKLGVTEGREIAPGLGFIGDDVFVDQHLLVRGRFARMLPAMLKKGYKLGWASTRTPPWSSTRGARSKWSATRARCCSTCRPRAASRRIFNVSNVQDQLPRQRRPLQHRHGPVHALGRQGRRPDRSRQALLTGTAVQCRHPGQYGRGRPDVQAGRQRPDRGHRRGHGPPGRIVQPDLGFEFRFSRTKESVGYASATSEAYSVHKLRLDIRPIQLNQPLYQYK